MRTALFKEHTPSFASYEQNENNALEKQLTPRHQVSRIMGLTYEANAKVFTTFYIPPSS